MTPQELIASAESRLKIINEREYGTQTEVVTCELLLAIAKLLSPPEREEAVGEEKDFDDV